MYSTWLQHGKFWALIQTCVTLYSRQNITVQIFVNVRCMRGIQDGTYWSALEGVETECVAVGASGGDPVRAQISCVPDTGILVKVQESFSERKASGKPAIGNKVGTQSATCAYGYETVSCNCYRYTVLMKH